MDTRTERQRRHRHDWQQQPMISAAQLQALCEWLRACADDDRPKFILCGGVFGLVGTLEAYCPETCLDNDGWLGYPATWQAVLHCIAEHAVRNVFFVSGDPHLSATATLTVDSGRHRAKVHALVASAFNASLPFANAKPHDYVFGEAVELPGSSAQLTVSSRATLLCDGPRQFTRIDVEDAADAGWIVQVRVFDETGALRASERIATEPVMDAIPVLPNPA
jgi:cholesterol oxidase